MSKRDDDANSIVKVQQFTHRSLSSEEHGLDEIAYERTTPPTKLSAEATAGQRAAVKLPSWGEASSVFGTKNRQIRNSSLSGLPE